MKQKNRTERKKTKRERKFALRTKQGRKCMYNETLWSVHANTVAMGTQQCLPIFIVDVNMWLSAM
jgi:hypothetical protein